jgi:transposase InsO family protein
VVTKRLAAIGIRGYPTAARSPWQNGHAERLIGSIRSECLDHVVAFGESDLRRILAGYASYYNAFRTHLSVGKDAPAHRPVQRFGQLAVRHFSVGFIINTAGCSSRYGQVRAVHREPLSGAILC